MDAKKNQQNSAEDKNRRRIAGRDNMQETAYVRHVNYNRRKDREKKRIGQEDVVGPQCRNQMQLKAFKDN